MTNSLPIRKVIDQLKLSSETAQTLILKLEDLAVQLEGDSPPEIFPLSMDSIPKSECSALVDALDEVGYTLMPSGMVVKNRA